MKKHAGLEELRKEVTPEIREDVERSISKFRSHFPDRQSRDLFPKPFSKHYTERFPWTERDDKDVTWAMIGAAALGFGSCVGIIYFLAWVATLLK